MNDQTIALLALVLAVVGSVAGSFAYLMGEMRKVSSTASKENETLEDRMVERLKEVVKAEQQARQELRRELMQSNDRLGDDVRRLSENVVKRADVDAIETRLTRSYERMEGKFDTLLRSNNGISQRMTQLALRMGVRSPLDIDNGDAK